MPAYVRTVIMLARLRAWRAEARSTKTPVTKWPAHCT